jgi:predicted dehydrogenase
MAVTRRAVIAGLTAASYARVRGANDRIGVGFIGYGLIGAQHVKDFRHQPDTGLVAVCDVYQPRLEQGAAACGPRARGYADFRKMLENKDIDAMVVSTPDHWHALATILSCAAGKDVYVEKPLSVFVREGRWMATAAARYRRVVQVGTQQRSGPHYRKAAGLIRSGYIGRVVEARSGSFRNIMPGFGSPADSAPPPGLDYDLWLGPAPRRPYNPHRSLYHFRWFWDYAGGQMTNLGSHDLDIVQWAMQVKGPSAVSSSGGRFALQDNGETPDTQDALFEYPGFTAAYSFREASQGRSGYRGLEFCGTKGMLAIHRAGFEITPDNRIDPDGAIPTFSGQPVGGPVPSAARSPAPAWCEPMKETGSSAQQLDLHVRNFLDCVKSREQPVAGVEDGHRTATTCHLANIALRTGRKLRWDTEKEEIVGDREAATYLERPYRRPWDEVLRSLHL